MCEIFGVTAARRIRVNELLHTFFSHSTEHRNGWGLVLLDDQPVSIEKEPKRAVDSLYLQNRLKSGIETARCLAHIRRATIGDVCPANTHPFSRQDDSGRRWILAHNGTIFDSEILAPYQYVQEGATDSERILLYLVDEVNRLYGEQGAPLGKDQRIGIVEKAARSIAPGNKLNFLLYDGDFLYVHKNEAGTLFQKETEDGVIFSTRPLDDGGWTEVPGNQLFVYRDGKLIYTGARHEGTYVHSEEKLKLLYFAYSGL